MDRAADDPFGPELPLTGSWFDFFGRHGLRNVQGLLHALVIAVQGTGGLVRRGGLVPAAEFLIGDAQVVPNL